MKPMTQSPETVHMMPALSTLRGRKVPLFVRIKTHLPATLIHLADGTTRFGRVTDLSVGGMFLTTRDPLPVGAKVFCCLLQQTAATTRELYAGGSVVHRNPDGMGIAFDRLTPEAFNAISDMIAASGCFLMRAIDGCRSERRVRQGHHRNRARPRRRRITRA